MPKRIGAIQKNNPELAARPEIKEITDDIDQYASIAALASSEGGVLLLTMLHKDIAATVDMIANSYKTMPEMELRATCALLETRITFARTLNRASSNLEDAEAMLKELIA